MAWVKPDDINVNAPWKNENFNLLKAALDSAFGDLDFSNFTTDDPDTITLYGDIVGGGMLYNFSNMFGSSTSTAIIDACAYGLDPRSSAANNKIAMEAAIDAVPTTGGVVLVPPGTYDINGPIYLEGTANNIDHIYIKGFGPSSKFDISTGSASGLFYAGSLATSRVGHRISDICIDGSGGSSSTGIMVRRAVDCRIDRVYIRETQGASSSYAGIKVDYLCDGVSISSCDITDCQGYGIHVAQSSSFGQSANIKVLNNRILSGLSGVAVDSMESCIVDGNYIKDSGSSETQAGISVFVPAGTRDVDPASISGNIIHCGSDGCGILITHAYGSGEWIVGLSVTENIVYAGTDANANPIKVVRAPGVNSATCYVYGLTFMSNIAMDNYTHGIHFQGHAESGATTESSATRSSAVFGNIVMRSTQGSGLMVHSADTSYGATDKMKSNAFVANVSSDDRGGSATQAYGANFDVHASGSAGWIQDHVLIGNVLNGNVSGALNDESLTLSHGHNPGH